MREVRLDLKGECSELSGTDIASIYELLRNGGREGGGSE